MTGAESEALGLIAQQHGSQVAVADTDLAVISNRTGNAEGLESFAQGLGDFRSDGLAALDGDSGADEVGPAGVFKTDGLDVADALDDVQTFGFGDLLGFVQRSDAVGFQEGFDLGDPAFITFKKSHDYYSLNINYCLRGSMTLTASAKRP